MSDKKFTVQDAIGAYDLLANILPYTIHLFILALCRSEWRQA